MALHSKIPYKQPAIASLTAIAAFLAGPSGCQNGVEVGFKPDFVPIEVFVNTQGDLWVRFDGAVVTPIGTFTVNETPDPKGHEGDLLVAFSYVRHGEPVSSWFSLEDFAKGDAELAVTGGSGVEITQDEDKATIEIPAGVQEFKLEPDNYEEVAEPASTSVTRWSEPPSMSPTPSPTPSDPSNTISPPSSTSATVSTSEVVPTG
jgi:hypothetical protein